MKIAVTGAQGQLGATLVHELARDHDVCGLSHADCDLTDDAAVSRVIAGLAPDAIVNAAAYNDVDAAEDHPIEALSVNAFGVRALAHAARACGAVLVHYSTDFVFDGRADRPYVETDRPEPRSVYAVSKLLGEWFADDAPGSFVLRVESLFGQAPGGRPARGSVMGLLNAMREGREVHAFEDRTVSPTFIPDAAIATKRILETQPASGLYHCVNTGQTTWLELAVEMARLLGIEARIVPVRLGDTRLRAARPQFCALSNAKLAAAGISMPPWPDALRRYLFGT